MADTKQSALTPRGTPSRSTDTIMVVNGSTNYVSTVNNELGISGNPVGDTDTQTLTNKTLTGPTITGPTFSGTITGTYTLGGTPTFPASVVTLTGSQILTSKTLTSPTLTSPTLTNASITQDAVVGFTTANSGTVYGISVVNGALGTNALGTNAVQANQLATNAISLGYNQIIASFSTTASATWQQVTGLTITVTIPSGGRRIEITAFGRDIFKVGGGVLDFSIWDGAVGTGTMLADIEPNLPSASAATAYCSAIVTPAPGTKTYNVGINPNTAAVVTLEATATAPAYILAKVI